MKTDQTMSRPLVPDARRKPSAIEDFKTESAKSTTIVEEKGSTGKKTAPPVPCSKTKPKTDPQPAGFISYSETQIANGKRTSSFEVGLKIKPPVPSLAKPSVVFEEKSEKIDKKKSLVELPPLPDKKRKPIQINDPNHCQVTTADPKIEVKIEDRQTLVKSNQGEVLPQEEHETLQRTKTIMTKVLTLQRTKTIMTKFRKTKRKGSQLGSDPEIGDEVGNIANKKSNREKKAFTAAEEIMTSEKTYVDVLKILDKFRISLDKEFPEGSAFKDHVCGRTVCLSQIPTLLDLNSHLLEEFEDRIKNWDSQRKIADVLVAKASFLKLYSTYLDHFQEDRKIFEGCLKKFPAFAKFLGEYEKHSDCQGLGILGHMLAPVQRVPRYKMLLEAYLKYQEEDSIDYWDSQRALKIVSSVADATNQSLIGQERRAAMKKLSERVRNDFELVKPGRELLKEEVLVNLAIREVPQPWEVLLVTDALLFAYMKVHILLKCEVNTISSGRLQRH